MVVNRFPRSRLPSNSETLRRFNVQCCPEPPLANLPSLGKAESFPSLGALVPESLSLTVTQANRRPRGWGGQTSTEAEAYTPSLTKRLLSPIRHIFITKNPYSTPAH